MLEVYDLEAGYGEMVVLHGLTFRVNEGELVAFVGANGAGKSTLLKTIAGAIIPKRGRIVFEGEDITACHTPEVVSRGITYVPEARLIFGPLTVEENLELGAYPVKDEGTIRENLGLVYQLFPRLKERRRQRAGTLSGGEQQMLAIGRALMSNPKLLMLDEPSLGLMPKLVDEVLETVARLKELGRTIILVEQKVRESLEIADRGYVLQTGRIVLEGEGRQLLETDLVRRAFLGL